MLSDVRNYYGLTKDFGQVGYYETGQSQQIVKELSQEIRAGKLVTLSGIVGSGKTTMLRRIQETLAQEKEILVSKSLSVDKGQLSLPVLINALFYDLATEKDFKISRWQGRGGSIPPPGTKTHVTYHIDCKRVERFTVFYLFRNPELFCAFRAQI